MELIKKGDLILRRDCFQKCVMAVMKYIGEYKNFKHAARALFMTDDGVKESGIYSINPSEWLSIYKFGDICDLIPKVKSFNIDDREIELSNISKFFKEEVIPWYLYALDYQKCFYKDIRIYGKHPLLMNESEMDIAVDKHAEILNKTERPYKELLDNLTNNMKVCDKETREYINKIIKNKSIKVSKDLIKRKWI